MAAGDPTGNDLCSGTTDVSTLPLGSWEDREVVFDSPYALVSGTKYAIIVRTTGDYYIGWAESTGDAYPNNSFLSSSNAGTSWSQYSTYDEYFVTKASGIEKDSVTFVGGETTGFLGNTWFGQHITPASSYSVTSIVLRLMRVSGSNPGTITVSIRATVPETPTKATTPAPANAATNVTLGQATLTWVDGGGATSYDVYYGTTSGNLTKVSSAQAGTSFTITGITNGSPFSYLITRYWRIDSTNDAGTTTGDEWSFTTIRFRPPGPAYWYSTGEYWYQLLVQADGTYGNPPPTGVENTDYVIVSFAANFIRTARKLVAAANNTLWYENI